jgi:hypothetical protein
MEQVPAWHCGLYAESLSDAAALPRGDRHHCRAIITVVPHVGLHHAAVAASARAMENTGDELVAGWGLQRPDRVALFAHGARSP